MAGSPEYLDMSDEDFLNQMPASGELAPTPEPKEPDAPGDTGDKKTETPVETPEPKEPKEPADVPDEVPANPDVHADGDDEDEDDDEESPKEVEAEASPDYETFYKQIMTPFKANGRTVELKTPEEAIQLMQMGANYTRKMQELAPQRKLLTMLQTNGLDEGKLNYLIDLDKKNPEAIKKLIKDAGIDPLEIDTSVEPAYREGNHRVTDEEVNFQQTLADMQSTPEQVKTLQVINGDWDQVSKEALWKNPEIMTVIHGQRASGVYDRIATELNRQRTLGHIPSNIPFLQAYRTIGEQMTKANAFADLEPATPALNGKPAPVVVATRVAAPKAQVKNSDRAAAASTSRNTSGKTKAPPANPLAMSDEDFEKLDQFDGRV